jgi:hypothetical protein
MIDFNVRTLFPQTRAKRLLRFKDNYLWAVSPNLHAKTLKYVLLRNLASSSSGHKQSCELHLDLSTVTGLQSLFQQHFLCMYNLVLVT